MTGSILVVDDMPEMQQMLNCSLASAGHRVATAGSGEEALARIEAQEFDLIVTDIVMPGLSGLEVLKKSQELNPRAAVIVMTAYATLETAVTALRRGACDYLEKPLSLDDLNLRVRRALEDRGAIWRGRRGAPHSLPHVSADARAAGEIRSRNLREALRRFELQHLMSVIAETRSDKRAAARLLGISLASLYRKLNVTPDVGARVGETHDPAPGKDPR